MVRSQGLEPQSCYCVSETTCVRFLVRIAAAVKWLDVDSDVEHYRDLYASHKEWVDSIKESFKRAQAEVVSSSSGKEFATLQDVAAAPQGTSPPPPEGHDSVRGRRQISVSGII